MMPRMKTVNEWIRGHMLASTGAFRTSVGEVIEAAWDAYDEHTTKRVEDIAARMLGLRQHQSDVPYQIGALLLLVPSRLHYLAMGFLRYEVHVGLSMEYDYGTDAVDRMRMYQRDRNQEHLIDAINLCIRGYNRDLNRHEAPPGTLQFRGTVPIGWPGNILGWFEPDYTEPMLALAAMAMAEFISPTLEHVHFTPTDRP